MDGKVQPFIRPRPKNARFFYLVIASKTSKGFRHLQSKTEFVFLEVSARLFGNFHLGRARYRPIDDRARYWANFFLVGGGKMNLENFQRKKKKKE